MYTMLLEGDARLHNTYLTSAVRRAKQRGYTVLTRSPEVVQVCLVNGTSCINIEGDASEEALLPFVDEALLLVDGAPGVLQELLVNAGRRTHVVRRYRGKYTTLTFNNKEADQ